jgi:uncharacterized membrane protein YiaA
MNKDLLLSVLVFIVTWAGRGLIVVGVVLYILGISEKIPRWSGWGLWCLNGVLTLGLVSGALIVIDRNGHELTPDVRTSLYHNELITIAIYTVLIVIHLFRNRGTRHGATSEAKTPTET